MFLKSLFLTGATLSLATASAILTPLNEKASAKGLSSRQTSCTHGPDSRDCWDGAFNIGTDSEVAWPVTGRVVPVGVTKAYPNLIRTDLWLQYTLELTERVLEPSESPDGTRVTMLLINGVYPGPTLTASMFSVSQWMKSGKVANLHRLGRWIGNYCH